jgi:dephospho-CoA kinase
VKNNLNQFIIGLTGGISTGKTTVANHLAQKHQLPLFDADIYAREAVQVGSPILNTIAQKYGAEILLEDGSLNRPKLGQIIFNDINERRWVEQQIHPEVRQRFEAVKASESGNLLIFVIPLLFEAQMTDLVTEIWVVSCPVEQQLARLMQRDHLSEEQAKARIESQMSLIEKCQNADVVIENSSTREDLFLQVDVALKQAFISEKLFNSQQG